jgi:hypothetical protein
MYVLLLVLILVLGIPFNVISQQEGCTDPDALNYESNATVNDGTCIYARQNYHPSILVGELADTIAETSGLIYWRGKYWTHNDSDGANKIYSLDSQTGAIVQSIEILNAVNFDWEELTHDSTYIYIADLGNNWGNRRDLSIYKIKKNDIPETGDTAVVSEKIIIYYGDQESYEIKNRANDFDCEAMLSFGDSLYIFTKNWVSLTSRLYAVPKLPGEYVIYPLDEFNTDGLITGAAINPYNKTTVLCGYKNYIPFIWVLNDFWKNDFFGGNKRRVTFKELVGNQTEAVSFVGDDMFVISAEKTIVHNAKIFRVNLKEIR